MFSLVVVLAVFTLLLALGRRIELGYALFAGSLVLAAALRMAPAEAVRSIAGAAVAAQSLNLVASIFLVMTLNETLRESGQEKMIISALTSLLHDLRLVTFAVPATIGLLPMPGGAWLSAPMVDSALGDSSLPRDRRMFANYWFRHVWEYINPVYPGIIATAALTGASFSSLARINVWLTISAILYGAVFVFLLGRRHFPRGRKKYRGNIGQALVLARGILPLAVVLVMVIAFSVPVVPSLAAGTIIYMLSSRLSARRAWAVIRRAAQRKMLFMLLGIIFFQRVLNDSGAVGEIAAFLGESGTGPGLVIFLVPFLSGLVTGVMIAAVGISLPIVMPLMPGSDPGTLMFFVAAAFGGVLLSPVHLCLVLSAQFFKVNLFSFYRYLAPATVLVMAVGALGYLGR